MAGTVVLSTLNDSSGVLATQNGMTGIAKAWVNFNGTGTVAIRDSFNVSSITDNGTGDYTVNFTTAMPNANYSIVCGSPPDFASANAYATYINTIGSSLAESSPTTSAFRVAYRRSDADSYDPKYVNLAVFSS